MVKEKSEKLIKLLAKYKTLSAIFWDEKTEAELEETKGQILEITGVDGLEKAMRIYNLISSSRESVASLRAAIRNCHDFELSIIGMIKYEMGGKSLHLGEALINCGADGFERIETMRTHLNVSKISADTLEWSIKKQEEIQEMLKKKLEEL